MKKYNILVTGGAGYIGSHTAEILIKNKKKICLIDDLSTGFKRLINKNFALELVLNSSINGI